MPGAEAGRLRAPGRRSGALTSPLCLGDLRVERFAGRFALVRPLRPGGMGQVWLALDHPTRTECALKRLEVRLPRAERDSLRREFEVLARVRHPAVVSVYELGFAPDGTPFYTMEVVPGRPADAALAPGR